MGERMRVTVIGINSTPEPTGIAPYTSRMAAGLQERGHEVSVVTAFPHYPQWRVAEGYSGRTMREVVEGVSVTRMRHFVPSTPVGLARARSEISFGWASTTRSWGDPDVVVCVSPALLSTAMSMLRARGGRAKPAIGVVMQDLYSAGISETEGGSGAVGRVFRRLESRVARRADGVAVIHDRFRDRVVSDLGVDPDRVTVIRNWTHVEPVVGLDRAATRASLGWRDDETIVLHTGAMGEKQDLGNVVEAAREVDRVGAAVRFVLMGDGGQRGNLEAQAAGVRSIEFLDPVAGDRYPHVLASADLLLVNERPGLVEMAVPSKLTSYFNTGLPVLAATNQASTTADEIRASGAGEITAAGDPAALVAKVVAVTSDPDWARALGAAGPDYCAGVLSEKVALDAYDRWVRSLHSARHERQR